MWSVRALLLSLCLSLLGGALWIVFAAELNRGEVKGPLSPETSLPTWRLPAGLKLELVASEPAIESPVAMAFDEDGKLWVVEMRDYPNGPAKGQPPEGRIKVLEDRDGDGRYEHSTIFADQVLFGNGLMPWKGGVIVTAAPHVLYLKDTDGDGKADRRDVLFEGFAALNPQLRVNHPILGIDNWIYVANGLRGGQVVKAGDKDAKPINLSGMDFRFDLIHDRHEAISGMGQYGNAFDDWGRRFVCDNRRHLRHIVMPSRYIQRNPFLAVPEVVEDISELEAGVGGAGAKVYPLSKNWTTSNLHAGRFTAACSVFIYRGDLLPGLRDHAFTCDPTGNLVHEEIMKPAGATFRSKPAKEGVEFLASPDDWCRPVYLADGPDGALYVVDMYRAVIEHPEFMPTELKNRPDLTLGKDRGRIWRIVPSDAQRSAVNRDAQRSAASKPALSKATIDDLVKLLSHPNSWWRTTAQRLILERQDKKAIEPLVKLLKSESPLARLHAAWLLDGLGALQEANVQQLLQDEHPRVREQAVVLSERWIDKSKSLQDEVIDLVDDGDAQVRFQVALTLGQFDDDRIIGKLGRIALAGCDDRWTRIAVASSVPKSAGRLVVHLLTEQLTDQGLMKESTPGRLALLKELTALVGARRDVAEVALVLAPLGQLAGKDTVHWQMTALSGLADGMGRRGAQLGEFLKALPADKSARTEQLLQQAAAVADDGKRDLSERLTAVRLLAHAPWTIAEPALVRFLNEAPAQEVRLASVAALAAHPKPEVPGILMKTWRSYTPAVRREVTEAMLRQPERIQFFLGELEAGRVKPGDLDALRIRQLVNHTRPDVRDRAKKLLHDNLPAERKQVLERYQASLKLKGDPARGKAIFQKNCATCHRIAGVGVDVAPDISDTRTKTFEALLLDILNPNAAIDNNFINYNVITKSGKTLSGIIVVETASSITLKRAEAQTDVVLRQDIDEIQSTGVSLMPEGMEKQVTVEEMGDLLSFLKNWRYLDGAVPLPN